MSVLRLSIFMIFAALAAAGAPLSASAQDADSTTYSAQDVIKHFARGADLGEKRALCIGTPAECGYAADGAAVAEPAPFNLRVQFELNSAVLTPEARVKLEAFAQAAASDTLRRAQFRIDGYTDARGSDALNQTLSERRAQSVVAFLVDRGVQADRLVAAGHGESQPLDGDPMNDKNRRVEASLSGVR